MPLKKFFFRFFSIVLIMGIVFLSIFIGFRAYKEMNRNKKIADEILALQEESNRIDHESYALRNRIEYLQSDSFREREAKRVLEYQKSGEKVVFVRGQSFESKPEANQNNFSSETSPITDMTEEKSSSNFEKWYRYFFEKS